MIDSRKKLEYYLEQDKIALGKKDSKRPRIFSDEEWRFEILLRKTEYYCNCGKGLPGKLMYMFYKFRYHRMCVKLGFHVPLNVFGEGLAVFHIGALAVNSEAKVGKNCRIHATCVIGASNGETKAPVIGDNVYIGSGAKILGDIRIADDVAIGANAVVVKSIDEPGTTWGGVPAKMISRNGSAGAAPKMIHNGSLSVPHS